MRPFNHSGFGLGIASLVLAAGAAGWAANAQDAAPGLASAPAATSQPISLRLATCDVYKIAERLMKQERFSAPLQSARQKADEQLAPLAKELETIRARIEAKGNPQAARDDIMLFQQKQQTFQQTQQQLERDFDRFAAQTNNSAFIAVVEAAQRVAKDKGYTHVFSTRPADVGAGPETQLQFTLGILARPVVVYPEQDDITEAVMTDMKVE